MLFRIFTVVIVFFLVFGTTYSQNETSTSNKKASKRSYTTQSLGENTPPKIDGTIDEDVWNLVPWTTDYVEFQPDNGTAPTEQTKMKILYDAKNIYVAFICYDKDPAGIAKRLSRRDGFSGDFVEISLGSYNDQRTAFSFTVTAAGVKADEFISNNGNFDQSYNPIWYTKTQIDAEGWTAEMRIPLTQLRFGNENEQIWALQSKRRYFRKEERSLWQPIIQNAPGYVSEFGELRGIIGLKPQKQLEIQPYGLASLSTYPEEVGNPFRDGSDTKFTGGVDAKIGVTNDLTLDLTINPDFGQVDADPGAISLDGFELFFQEQRPFFVENNNIFNFRFAGNQDNLFFSRRIGRSPQGSAFGPATAYVDQPDNTTIIGAAKFSGKTKNGWSVGVLESVTAKEFAETIDTLGQKGKKLVEPLTNYFVGRLQKDFNDHNTYIGGIFTATNRKNDKQLTFLHKNAYTGGVDFQHLWHEKEFYVEGDAVISQVIGTKDAITETQRSIVHLFQRVDASHVSVDTTRTSLTGSGGRFEIGKGGGGNWSYNLGGNWRSPELELNDLGFLRNADEIKQYANIRRFFNTPSTWYRRANLRLSQSSSYDFEGNFNRMQYEFSAYANYTNNWWTDIDLGHKPRIYINSYLRGGPRWRYSEENFISISAGTDDLKKLSFNGGLLYAAAKQTNFITKYFSFGIRYQPLNALNLSLNTSYDTSFNKTQYVDQATYSGITRYLTGQLDQETLSTTLRINYTINPNLTIQYYGQPFISRGRYSNFNYVNNATAKDLNERVTNYTDGQISLDGNSYLVDENSDGITDYSFGKPDFAFVQYRSNLVLRWEYIPGSEIFLVWSQGINGLGNAANNFSDIIDQQLLNQQPQNKFLIKATYRIVL